MNAPPRMETTEVLKVKLQVLRREHRDLDEAIAAMIGEARADALTLQRLKKRKLALKDRIRELEDQITPDIIA